jgi:hypothetical protein
MPITSLGITGHRTLAEIDEIHAGVESALRCVLGTFPDSHFRILSSLAEGADRILVKRLLEIPNTFLWVSLPLPQMEYIKDFETIQSKEEFVFLMGKAERVINMPVKEKREEGFLAAGKYILDNCDVLLAIWDGKPAKGVAGTGEIVTLARERGLPMVWIHANNHSPGKGLPTPLSPDQGSVSFEHFPPSGRKK